ncbi:MAG: M15 family metallopeptidase [Prevotella sp.]|nr:M15 family metallopeptidase [Prevotella sp.]
MAVALQTAVPSTWQAGEVVDSATVAAVGEDCCFTAMEINDSLWQRMQGKTYIENPNIGRDDLRHVRTLHWDLDGKIRVGEMVCNRLIAQKLVDIFHELYKARYPIERMVLPDEYDADDERQMQANNTSCFCYRAIAGSKSLSKHALGLAVDLNTLYNPYVKRRTDGTLFIQPVTGAPYCDRTRDFPYKITHEDLAYRLFAQHGFTWGGDWQSHKDYQHFEWPGSSKTRVILPEKR